MAKKTRSKETIISTDQSGTTEEPLESRSTTSKRTKHTNSSTPEFKNPYEPEFTDQSSHERFLEMTAKWRSEFEHMNSTEQQQVLLSIMQKRLYWRIISYMRRFPDRLTSGCKTYSDCCVGIEEMRSYMGSPDEESFPQKWLDNNHVPKLDEANNTLLLYNAQLAEVLQCPNENAIARIKRSFALNDLELEILATLVIAMQDEATLRMMVVTWADFMVRIPTVTFLADLLCDTPEGVENVKKLFSEQGKLRRYRLVIAETHALFPNYTPCAFAPISIEQTVIDAFCGKNQTRDLPHNMILHTKPLPKRALICSKSTLEELEHVLTSPTARLLMTGPKHSGRRTLACAISLHNKNKPVLEIDACREFERLSASLVVNRFSTLMREALLRDSILMLRFDDIEEKTEILQRMNTGMTQISHLIENYPGEIVVLSDRNHPIFDDIFAHITTIHVQLPDMDSAKTVWQKALKPWTTPENCSHMAETFSRNYSLPIGSIFEIVHDTAESLQSTNAETTLQSHHILTEIRKSFRHQLGSLAEITVSDVPLSGVVLPDEAKAQVNEILEYAKNLHNVLDTWGFRQRSPYGNALSVLFAGPPGTGKTLLACAMANELGKVLYRVDLSRIVDKYIGETEKNLGKIFDEAAKAQAIILFDEADSLFAKRTEVKSSNDRYANLEINYLLQKLESYNGITILTTNLSKSIDEAFRRRLRFIIDFPMPDIPSRIALWKRMMPPNAPLSDDIRWSWLARTFEMSGGYIRNAVLKAAIAASAANKPISMEHLSKAAAAEARSMGILMRIDDNYDDDVDDEEIANRMKNRREHIDEDSRF